MKNNNLKEELKKRFKENFDKKCRLLAIQLNGFSHKIFYDRGSKNTNIEVLEFSHYTANNPNGAKATFFKGIPHYIYQDNPLELIYIQPDER